MKDVELTPAEVLSWPHEVDLLNTRAWSVRWDGMTPAAVRDLAEHRTPPLATFHTSGSTGDPKPWQLRPQQMLAEVTALAAVLGGDRFDGVVAFAPPLHRYGAHCTVLLPAVLGCPVWTRPRSVGGLPPLAGGHWLVVAIPNTFAVLRQRLDWLATARSVTVIHSSARLPETAHHLLTDLPQLDLSIVEILGSTESGAVATRTTPPGGDVWSLVPGVTFAARGPAARGEERLAVRSPWLARAPGATGETEVHELNDVVERRGSRGLRLVARAGRVVKVNGEKHHLDDVTARFGAALGGREVACVGVTDPVVGEHFELYVVDPSRRLDVVGEEIRQAIETVGLHPRRVRLVTALATSSTGKVLFRQPNTRDEVNRDTSDPPVDRRPESH
jgi:acyl-coenzyme A synthetase/AMP-(fatty) acid ligase